MLGVSYKHPPWGPAKRMSRSVRMGFAVCISVVAAVALVAKRTSQVQLWQPAWLQVAGSGFSLGFAGLLVFRRVSQRAWRGFSPDEYRPSTEHSIRRY